MIPLNYHHLYYFYVIARAGSITKACETLLLAQATVSTQLQELEKAFGRPLFERRKKRLFLTEDGRIVLDYAESIFDLGRELQDTLRDKPRVGPRSIQIGFLNGTHWTFTQAVIRCVLDATPLVHVSSKEAPLHELVLDLREQRLDVIVTDASVWIKDQREELSNHLIAKIPVVFAAAPRLARKYKRIPQDFNGAPFILRSTPGQTHQQVLDLFAARKISPRIVTEVQDIELARRLAISGVGIVPLNAYTLAMSTPAKELTVLGRGILSGVYESLYLVTRKRKWPNPLVEYLIDNFRLRW